MQVRKKFRRIKRFAYLGAITGTVVTWRRQRARRANDPLPIGSPATWPPLRPSSDQPVAHVESLGDDSSGGTGTGTGTGAGGAGASTATVADNVPPATPAPQAAAPVTAEEPVAAVGDLAAEQAGGDTSAAGTSWVEPNDGSCPLSHPVKANANSGIYHVPGGRFYERTQAERCYVDAASAEADGYRAAKDR